MYNEADGRSRLSFEGASYSDLLRGASNHELRNTTINCIRIEELEKYPRPRRKESVISASWWHGAREVPLSLPRLVNMPRNAARRHPMSWKSGPVPGSQQSLLFCSCPTDHPPRNHLLSSRRSSGIEGPVSVGLLLPARTGTHVRFRMNICIWSRLGSNSDHGVYGIRRKKTWCSCPRVAAACERDFSAYILFGSVCESRAGEAMLAKYHRARG
jgi:hypothetical protein